MWFIEKTPTLPIKVLLATIIGLCTFQTVRADDTCVRDQASLRTLLGDQNFPTEWVETTADDGKPLLIKMSTRENRLYFVFDKTKEGVWAEGPIEVCPDRDNFLIKISGQDITVGESAPRLIRWSMNRGATFRLKLKAKDQMHVSVTGWSGDFVPN